jgi:hypothetical protein
MTADLTAALNKKGNNQACAELGNQTKLVRVMIVTRTDAPIRACGLHKVFIKIDDERAKVCCTRLFG